MTTAVTPASAAPCARHGLRVRGVVQGVGFRPAVFRLARELGLGGLVRNDAAGVWIEIEGAPESLVRFAERVAREVPPPARVEALDIVALPPRGDGDRAFAIAASAAPDAAPGRAPIPPDVATCEDCLRELLDPADRRHRYPFINCTACGPRATIVRDLPYDRARTTMAAFTLCARCRAEYDDPADRRFHAEPNACPACGPRLHFHADTQPARDGEAALSAAIAALRAGRIVAVKGLGGFHLAVDAADEAAVARLRTRKRRPHRPLAIMVRSLAVAEELAVLGPAHRDALTSPARPIVLCPRRADAALARGVAPGLDELGLILPYTPLHHLLLADGPRALVMTSGNRAEEPIARVDGDAAARLAGIADAFLGHDREIHTRADDSVVRIVAGGAQPVRRSRGYVPEPIALGCEAPPLLAVGAELKNTVCLTRGAEAYLSPHIGDLENLETYELFTELIGRLGRFLGVTPRTVAHDLHPDYLSTRWALESKLPREPVQHHHAHIAACLVEHGHHGPALGVAFDGTGCGPDGGAWGGELLLCDLTSFQRLAHLRPLALPGGEAAIREPWRLAAAALLDSGLPLTRLAHIPPLRLAAVARLCERAPRVTGAGRWFDAVAALCGVRDEVSYEGQAAVELEAAVDPGEARPYPFGLIPEAGLDVVDLRPTVRAISADLDRGEGPGRAAARFHRTLAAAILATAERARARTGASVVALSGGCFTNRLLTEATRELLAAAGFEVLIHRRVPPGDGGIALGQAAVAAHRHRARHHQAPASIMAR